MIMNELQDDDELKSQFNQLLNAFESIDDNSSEEDVRALNERIQHEVLTSPFWQELLTMAASSSFGLLAV